MVASSLFQVGQKKAGAPKLKAASLQVFHGSDLCRGVVSPDQSRMTTVPSAYQYLLEGRNGTPWFNMPQDWQEQRFNDLSRISWNTVHRAAQLIQSGGATRINSRQIDLIPPSDIPSLDEFSGSEAEKYQTLGENLIRGGYLARVTIAGGEATRFRKVDDPRPKALVEIANSGPFASETYLSVEARDLLLAQYRYQTTIPWLLFISPAQREAFEKYFGENSYFGLDPESVILCENTAFMPKFTRRGKIALMADADGGNPNDETIAFYNSGHGAWATAFRENQIIINGRTIDATPHSELSARGIKYINQTNVDNLGGRISTGGFSALLGFYHARESETGCEMVVELTTPLIGMGPDGEKFFWDEGGVALKVNGIPTIVDANALEGDVIKQTRDPENPFPFNTATATYGIDSLPEGIELPFILQKRAGLLQAEQNFWNTPGTGQVRTEFIQVPREIPESAAKLPPTKKHPRASRLVFPAPSKGKDLRNRFIPVKESPHQQHAANVYAASVEMVENETRNRIKARSRILIIDDEADFMGTIVEALTNASWKNVDAAANEDGAMEKLRSDKYDYIVLDSKLKPGVTEKETGGARILKALKQDPKALNFDTQVLFWSSYESRIATGGLRSEEQFDFGKKGVEKRDKGELKAEALSEFIFQRLIGFPS